ncbi:hypothetical protein [Sporosarcina limicola]|uniref:Uncharacterized protein n=1 Tax=Sporosarcina limicola TaxID=34101 RepID=A0A927MLU2_9BACL|nr:hypothetical protein [Sporosarcina limicola]MBE1556333.1 hypothetical protein [Sporosarcina limicola]
MRTIVQCEIDKIIKNKTFIGALIVSLFVLAGILFLGFYYSQLQGHYKGEVDLYHKNVEEHTGDFTDQKVREILINYIDRRQSTDADNRPSDLFSWEIADTFFPIDEDITLKMNAANEMYHS